jgi:hypothetical protein
VKEVARSIKFLESPELCQIDLEPVKAVEMDDYSRKWQFCDI